MLQVDEIEAFVGEGLVESVEAIVRSGKEATVYRCRRGERLLAAKVYRASAHRSFRHDAVYTAGSSFGKTRENRAVATKTRFGHEVKEAFWVRREFTRMVTLHEAGVHVPAPVGCADRAILMEFVGDGDRPAPQLREVPFSRADASRALDWLLYEVEAMLRVHVVHADLSPYNALWWAGWPVVIDFPQAVDARENPNARGLLHRDVATVCRHFGRLGVERDAGAIARDLWERYRRARL